MLFVEALGGNKDVALPMAYLCEIVHNGTLCVDDIEVRSFSCVDTSHEPRTTQSFVVAKTAFTLFMALTSPLMLAMVRLPLFVIRGFLSPHYQLCITFLSLSCVTCERRTFFPLILFSVRMRLPPALSVISVCLFVSCMERN